MSTNGLDFSDGAQPPLGDNPDITFDPDASPQHISGATRWNVAAASRASSDAIPPSR